MGVDTGWKKSDYVSDLVWSAGGSPVTVGSDGTAEIIYRRKDGVLFWKIRVVLGAATSIPAGVWSFEMPGEINYLAPDFAGRTFPGVGIVRVAAAADVYQVGVFEMQTVNQSSLEVELIPFAPSYDAGSGQLQKTVPGTWAAGDYFVGSGWAACLDN